MKTTHSQLPGERSLRTASGRVLRAFVWIGKSLLFIAVVGWTSLAIYFSNLPWPAARTVLALTCAAFGIWAVWWARERRFAWIFAAVFVGVLMWWSTIVPSHARKWRADVAVLPTASVDGDRVTLTGVRNFEYRTTDDFTVHYETRQVSLAHLTGVDFYISYWMPGPIGHTFVSFTFDNAPPVSISIEARPEVNEGYAPIASLFKQFELVYVVGEERDIVGVRTNHRHEDVFLFRVETSPQSVRQLFHVYLERINALAAQPEFYHLLSNSCTVNIVRYANAAGRPRGFDIRHYFNGLIDGYLYETNRLNTTLPLEELRRRSHINEVAQAADNRPDFPERIRVRLPPVRR